ncbi:MAG: hypothetical protein ACK5PS_04065 [Desulfopila sp.]
MNRYLLVLLVLLLTGCASTRDNASFSFRNEAEGAFLEKDQGENYNFYVYTGWGERPAAYLALDKKYTLETRFWYKTAMSETLWREAYNSTAFFNEDDYKAKAIISSSGATVGYIISRYYQLFAWFTTPGGNTIIVVPPALSPSQPDYFRFNSDRY